MTTKKPPAGRAARPKVEVGANGHAVGTPARVRAVAAPKAAEAAPTTLKATAAPSATAAALLAHGYTEMPAGTFTRLDKRGQAVPTQQWMWKGDHWERYELGRRAYEGVDADLFGGLVRQRYPYRYREEFAVSARYEHPERWDWDWPDADVLAAYGGGE
jgi:hypothetical protein